MTSKSKKEKKAKEARKEQRQVQDDETTNSAKIAKPSATPKLYCRVLPLLKPTRSEIDTIDNIVPVNYDSDPIIINNEHFTGYAVFRVVNFDGHNPLDPKTGKPMKIITNNDYFNGHRRTFSLQISGRFKKEWSADEIMFGTFFEKPVKMPPGYKIALALAKKIDASMDGDLSLDEPYMCSPLICAMNIARSEPIILSSLKEEEDGSATTCGSASSTSLTFNNEILDEKDKPLYLPTWKYSDGKHIEENFMETVASWPESKLHHFVEDEDSDPLKEDCVAEVAASAPKRSGSLMGFFSRSSSTNEAPKKSSTSVTPSQRRSWFLDPNHRKTYKFRPDTLYSFDFNNQYVDLNKMHLKLGITFDVSYYLNGQPVRYQMKSRDGTVTFMTIELGLA